MVMRVQHVEGEYRVVLSAEALEALGLSDGAEVEVKAVAATAAVSSRYATVEETVEAYLRTEPFHRNTYRELAK